MSQDMRNVCQSIRIEKLRKEQDRLFERNMMIKQRIAGTVVCLLSIAGWWVFSEFYGQFELGLLVPPILFLGVYLIVTDTIIEKENR